MKDTILKLMDEMSAETVAEIFLDLTDGKDAQIKEHFLDAYQNRGRNHGEFIKSAALLVATILDNMEGYMSRYRAKDLEAIENADKPADEDWRVQAKQADDMMRITDLKAEGF
jgi:uncharacterized phage-associated protein